MVTDAINPAVIAALDELSDDGSFFDQMLAIFLDDLRPSLERMAEACDRGDALALARGVHRMKSSAANLGAVRMSEACIALEAALREDRLGAAVAEFSRLQDAASEVRAWAAERSFSHTGT